MGKKALRLTVILCLAMTICLSNIGLMTAGATAASPSAASSPSPTTTPKPTVVKSKPVANPDPYPSNPANLKKSNLYAQAAILIDGTTGEVLFEKNSDLRLMPASITKMMTCLLAIENCNLDDIVTVDSAANKCEATYLPVKAGEHIVLRDLITGMMLKSGNDAAIAVAYHVAGDEEAFWQMMNDRARAMGCTNTVYRSANGLTKAGHLTTAYDQALVVKACMANPVFREIVSTLEITIPANDVYKEDRVITNTNKFLPGLGDTKFGYEWGIGVKTGYTDAAQSTFAGAAEKDGVYLISVVLGSTKDGKWLDSAALFDYGFTRYQEADIANLYTLSPLKITLDNVAEDDPSLGELTLKLIVPPDAQNDPIRLTPTGLEALTNNFESNMHIEYLRELRAPVVENEPIARLTLTYGNAVFTGNLVASRAVEGRPMPVMQGASNLTTPTQLAEDVINKPTASLAKRFWWVFLFPALALMLIIAGCVLEIRHRKRRRSRSSYVRSTGTTYATSRRR